jgi:hypothetical protein
VGWPHPTYVTFLIALVSFGIGYAAQALVKRFRFPADEDPSTTSE